jgi:glycosyltransferase involved in cell wall biosynthesis
MKVLYDHQIFKRQKFGGVSRYFNELTKIESEGIKVDKIDPDLIPDVKPPGIFTRGFNLIKRKAGIRVEAKEEQLPAEVMGKISANDFDIFHPTYYDPYFLDVLKKPYVLTVYDMLHEVYPECFPTDKTSYNKKILCDNAKEIIAISQTTKDALLDIFKVPEEKVHTIHLASDFNTIMASKPSFSAGIENFILFTGTRGTYKNFLFAIRALADVLNSDKKLQLLCTGQAFNTDELSLFKELGVEGQVKNLYLKNDSELAWAYQNAQCFIFPSLYEGFGFPLLEAFASNCPIVSSTGGSLKEIGGDGVIFFDPKNIKEIQDEFAKYNWPQTRSKTLDIYKSII